MRYFVSVLFVLISSAWAVTSTPILLDGNEQEINLTPNMLYYLDTKSQSDIDTVRSENMMFKLSNKQRVSFGHQYGSTLWGTFTLHNRSTKSLEYLIEYVYPTVDTFSLYNERGELVDNVGTSQIKNFRKSLGHIIKISLPANTQTTYFMRVKAPSTAMKLELSLWKSEAYTTAKHFQWNIMSFFSGAMVILVLYNLMLFFFTRDSSYIYYVLVTFFILVHEGLTSGYILLFLEPSYFDSTDKVNILVLLSFMFMPFFARSFLQLKRHLPRIDLYLKYLPLLLVVITFLTLYELIPIIVNRLIFIVTQLSLVFIAYWALFIGIKQARYYVLGWSLVLGAFLCMAFNRMGFTTFDPEPYYLTQMAFLLEALIFSAGLAARIRYIKEEKEALDAKLIIQQHQEKERLESEVSIRTEELTKALSVKNMLLKEVHHRVKNNMQVIISLLRLQMDSFDDEKVEEAMSASELRIKAMGNVHEMLYSHEDISEINIKEYFHSLVDEARSAYDIFGNVLVKIETDVILSMEAAVYTGLIINELVSNAYKYAFDSNGGEITVSLLLEGNDHVLRVCDNGKGGELVGSANSLGMNLVQTLVTQQLKGNISTSTDKGVSHTIKFMKEVS